ncbi:MAG: twin-arginine translocation signal domain-containing protein [Candidatus Aenigmarchaeota archaeon]|nr:twin-arginine translocation signal domain-containing protein [Candidatus Aenigmarchaeota archaeon]
MNRRQFLAKLGIGGLVLGIGGVSFGQPEQDSQEKNISRILSRFPYLPEEIPGAGRINKSYVQNSRHLLIRVDQARLFDRTYGPYSGNDHLMETIITEQQRVEQVQEEVRHIMQYLIENDSESTPYFPRNQLNERVVYAQNLCIIHTLEFMEQILARFRDDELRRRLPLPNPSSKRLDAIQDYIKQVDEERIMAVHNIYDEVNFSVQNIGSADQCIDEFEWDTPVVTVVYSLHAWSDVRFYNNGTGNKFSLIEIIPETIVREEIQESD